jgi:outer membrane protein
MKKVALTLFCLTCLLLTSALARDLKIGVVDIEDIINTSPEYKRIESNLKRKSEELGRPVKRREQELSQKLADFQKQAQAGIIKDEARKRRESEFQRMFEDIQKSKDRAAKEFQEYYQREMKPLMDKLNRAVEQVADEENLDIVFPKAGIYLKNKSLDYTAKVRSRFR